MTDLLKVPFTPSRELVMWDKTDQRALINLLPPVVKDRVDEALFEKPELFDQDEKTLWMRLKETYGQYPNATDNRLRLKFWVEYDRAIHTGTQMQMTSVIANVCSRDLFYKYLKNPGKVAWLLCPPAGQETKAAEALDFGLDQLRDILEEPHRDNGKFNGPLAKLKLSIVQMLYERVKGSVIQKVEQKSLNVSLTSSDRSLVAGVAQGLTESTLRERIKRLEQEEREAMHLPPVVSESSQKESVPIEIQKDFVSMNAQDE